MKKKAAKAVESPRGGVRGNANSKDPFGQIPASPTRSGIKDRPTPDPTTTKSLLKGDRTSGVYTASRHNPFLVVLGRIENPDEVIRKMGGGQGLAFYSRMLRQFTFLGGLIGQRIDKALSRRPTLRPGDASDKESVRITFEVQRVWDDIREKSTVLKRMLRGIFFGFAPIELVWGLHEGTELAAPLELIDRPPENFVFDPNDQPRFLTVLNPLIGEEIDPLKFMFLRGGSRHTPYGEAELKDIYLATWYIQTIQQFGLEALEKLGRPIPWVEVPKLMDPDDRGDLESFLTKMFGTFVITPTNGQTTNVQFPALNVTAAGAAGRSEFEIIRYYVGWIYIRILRTQQTQDKTSGSRALESTRVGINDTASLADSELLCDALNVGWVKPIMDFNYPDLDPMLEPRFIPDPTADEDLDKLHRRVEEGVDRGFLISKSWYYRRFNVTEATDDTDVLGHPKQTITERADVTTIPQDVTGPDDTPGAPDEADPNAPVQPAAEPSFGANLVGVATTTGDTLYLDADRPVLTANRGVVDFRELTHGDELITLTAPPEENE